MARRKVRPPYQWDDDGSSGGDTNSKKSAQKNKAGDDGNIGGPVEDL